MTDGATDALAREMLIEFGQMWLHDDIMWKTELSFPKHYQSQSLKLSLNCAAIAMRHIEAAKPQWRPISTAPTDDTLFLAACEGGRMMIWRGSILKAAMKGNPPKHLQFPAVYWMPLPALPLPATTPEVG